MNDKDAVRQLSDTEAASPGPGQHPEPISGGCLPIFLALIALLMPPLALGIVVAIFGGADFPVNVRQLDHTEFPSPSGERVAVIDGFIDGDFFVQGFFESLAIKSGNRFVSAGTLLQIDGHPEWVGEDKLRITLTRMDIPRLITKPLGVTILVRLGKGLDIESYRKELRDQEAYFARDPFKESREACRTILRNWKHAREFHEWARKVAENGEPDPGPWTSNIYPEDCSTLPNP